MTIFFCSRPFGLPSNSLGSDSDFRQVGTLALQANGLYVIQWAPTPTNGIVPVTPATILGCGTDGSFSAGPASAIGNGQQFALQDASLVIRPNWFQGHALIPNAPTVPFVIGARVLG